MIEEKEIAEKFKASGKSQRKWCEEKGIRRSSLRYWLDRYEDVSIDKEIHISCKRVG